MTFLRSLAEGVAEVVSIASQGVLLGIGIALGMAVVERRRRRWRDGAWR